MDDLMWMWEGTEIFVVAAYELGLLRPGED